MDLADEPAPLLDAARVLLEGLRALLAGDRAHWAAAAARRALVPILPPTLSVNPSVAAWTFQTTAVGDVVPAVGAVGRSGAASGRQI
jgi:hypothetical protein